MKYILLSVLFFLLYRTFFPTKKLNGDDGRPSSQKNSEPDEDFIDYEEIDH